ncbi:protocadherin gamma-A8-like [Salmo trutta]|uniref:protocadherin gamma-A8-like n=1 Tax=Salmo trutta TaxID=8032 RepID=UPI0011307B69|nr:protocadherin gamma-A8-like [Salmo trutta]
MGLCDHRRRVWIEYLLLLCSWGLCSGQFVYSVSEEVDKGTFVGNIAKDLNLNLRELVSREIHIVTGPERRYFDVDVKTGNLFVYERIDREALCSNSVKCSIDVEAILNNPMHIHRIEVNIVDINDNPPSFAERIHDVNMTESAFPGDRFPLPFASDSDVGSNSVKTYKLSLNEHFSLDVQSGSEQSVSSELILQKALDREKQDVIKLVLTAVDGGKPPRSGTQQIVIHLIDANDNTPVFSKPLYKVQVSENVAFGTLILTLNATDRRGSER